MEDEVRPLLLDSPSNPMFILPWDPLRAKKSGVIILISVALERFAYYAVVMNLFLYLNKGLSESQTWEPAEALIAVYIINGVACLCSPVGGWISDSLLGRYWAVILGMMIYIVGYCLLTALSINGLKSTGCDWEHTNGSIPAPEVHWQILGIHSHPCSTHVYVILVLIGCGVGFLRANIPPFGAEQVRAGGDHAVRQFFNAYYWCINIGSLIGVGVLAYVEQNVENGFFLSYITATTALVASLIVFCSGRFFYLVHRPGNSVVFNMFKVVWEGIHNTCKSQESLQGSPMFNRRQQQQVAPIALTPSWIDHAKLSYGGSFHDATVEDVKRFSRNLVFICVLLPYWLVYFQMSTSFQAQGLHMGVHLNDSVNSDFQVPAAWLTLFDQGFVLLLIPLLNFIIYNASALPILYQIPQYCLIGTAEVFAGVAGLEYAYTTAPRNFQGIVMGLYAAIEGLGSFLSMLLVQITRLLHLGWIRSEIHFNQGHLDYFFYLLAVIQSVVIVIFGLVTYLRWEPPRREPHLEETLGASALHTEYYQAVDDSSPQPVA